VARYLEDAWPDDDLTWMQYLQERANVSPGDDLCGHKRPSTYNPYDYKDPSDKPKDMKDGPPFSQSYDEMGAEYGVTYTPKIYYDDDGIMKDWYKARRQDFTTDPSEQQPAISVDRKYASMEVDAASLKQVINADRHYKSAQKRAKVGSVTVALKDSEQDSMLKGHFEFRCQSQNSTEQHTVHMQFLRPKGRLRPASYLDYPVQLSCSCLSFLFYGAQYYAVNGKYMWMPGFRASLVPPIPQTMTSSIHGGVRHPGRGLNFTACKHILACYNWIEQKNLRILMHYRRYPKIGPPSKIMNAKEWERLMGFPFTLEDIQKKLTKSPILPRFFRTNFFRNKSQSSELEQWFTDTWVNRGDSEKVAVLETLVEHPEEIFYLLVKDAMESPTKLSPQGVEKAFELMSRVIQPENEQEPEGPEPKTPGTGVVIPKVPAKEPQEAPGEPGKAKIKTVKGIEPAIKEPGAPEQESPPEEKMKRFSPTKARQVAKKLRPWLTRSSSGQVVSMFLDRF
jgi:hypothetical protein